MKKISKLLLFASLVFGAAAAGAIFTTQKVSEVEAVSTTDYPRRAATIDPLI